ncbi:S-layer homology domain-containing protein [Paenibacillus amylolyticus]|nr:S-layer homology domain-containing protein [Paenibacillus amylolyticus]
MVRTLDLKAEFNTTFSDMKQTDLYYEEIGIAKALGIALGTNGSFYPGTEITRQDLAVLTMRALRAVSKTGQTPSAEDLKRFTDAANVAKYAVDDMAAMVKMGFINGRSNVTLSPGGTTTRAEAAQVLYKIFLQV